MKYQLLVLNKKKTKWKICNLQCSANKWCSEMETTDRNVVLCQLDALSDRYPSEIYVVLEIPAKE